MSNIITATVIKNEKPCKVLPSTNNDKPKIKKPYQPIKNNTNEFFRPLHIFDDHYKN